MNPPAPGAQAPPGRHACGSGQRGQGETCPVELLFVPAGHSEQEAAPAELAKPSAQGIAGADPPVQYEPDGQGTPFVAIDDAGQ